MPCALVDKAQHTHARGSTSVAETVVAVSGCAPVSGTNVRSGIEQETGGDTQDHAADKQERTIVGDEVIERLHTVPFVVRARAPHAGGRPSESNWILWENNLYG